MQIEVPTDSLKATLTETLEANKKQNAEIWKLYVKKVGEYSAYLKSFKEQPAKMKHEPYLQYEDTRQLRDALQGLSIHVGGTVKIDDREYRELLEGARRMKAGGAAHIMSLTALRY